MAKSLARVRICEFRKSACKAINYKKIVIK